MNHDEYLAQQRKRNLKLYKERQKGKTFQQLGEMFGITHQRAQQIYNKIRQEKE